MKLDYLHCNVILIFSGCASVICLFLRLMIIFCLMLIQVLCARYSDEEYFLNRCKGNILILLKVDFGCQEWKDDDASCFISVYIVCELIEHM